MRAKAPEEPPPEQPPIVAAIVREQLNSMFLASSSPRNVQVSPAHRDPRAVDSTACVKADVTSATGRPMMGQIYRIKIAQGKIVDRRPSDNEDNCLSETYEPI
jgi:biotin carboxyl carrier protein